MAVEETRLDDVLVGDRERWKDGPPHELFKRLRGECPVHWSPRITEYPDEEGFWSVTTADDIHEISHDWQTYSSERGGVTALTNAIMPLELIQSMFIGMDPPKHDRLKMLFQRGFTPKRIAEHEDAIRAITVGVLDRVDGQDECDLVTDVAQPVVSRVIGSFMGIPPEDDEIWARLMNATLGAGDPDLNPQGTEYVMQKEVPEIFERCGRLIAERRERPTDDLTSVLVHGEIEGERLEEHEIVMGFFLLVAAGNDSTKATYSSGMRALLENPDQRELLLDDPSLIPSAVEESLRMFPAFAHFRRTATSDVELGDQTIHEARRWSCGTCRRTATRRATTTPTASTSPATPSTRRSGPAAATFAWARRWRGWSCGSCSRRPWRASRGWSSRGAPSRSSHRS